MIIFWFYFRQWLKSGIPFLKDFEIKKLVEQVDFKKLCVIRLVAQKAESRLMKSYLTNYLLKDGQPILEQGKEELADMLADLEHFELENLVLTPDVENNGNE